MRVYNCAKGCCTIKISPHSTHHPHRLQRIKKKAGVFVFDPKENRVLLVQSRGQFWGPPKGTLEENETDMQCAIREVEEETGLKIVPNFTKVTKIKNRAVYYYMEMDSCPVYVQNDDKTNDANGITWIKIDCLEKFIEEGNISLNRHCKILFARFLNKLFPGTDFTRVSKKSKSESSIKKTRI